LPEDRLTAKFDDDSVLEFSLDLVGPSITKNEGIIGEDVELSLEHLDRHKAFRTSKRNLRPASDGTKLEMCR